MGYWFMSFPWTLGHISLGLLVYLIPNMKNLELFIGLSAVPFMSLWYFLPESPRWLLGTFNNHMDKILTIFDPHQMDKRGHFSNPLHTDRSNENGTLTNKPY